MPLTTMPVTIVPGAVNACLQQIWDAVQTRAMNPTDLAVKEMLDACAIAVPLHVQLWDYLTERMTCGMEKRELDTSLRYCLATLRVALDNLIRVQDIASKMPPRLDLNRADLQRLPGYLQQIETIHAKATAMLAELARPWPDLDMSKIPSASGKGVKLDEVLSDL